MIESKNLLDNFYNFFIINRDSVICDLIFNYKFNIYDLDNKEKTLYTYFYSIINFSISNKAYQWLYPSVITTLKENSIAVPEKFLRYLTPFSAIALKEYTDSRKKRDVDFLLDLEHSDDNPILLDKKDFRQLFFENRNKLYELNKEEYEGVISLEALIAKIYGLNFLGKLVLDTMNKDYLEISMDSDLSAYKKLNMDKLRFFYRLYFRGLQNAVSDFISDLLNRKNNTLYMLSF